MTRGLWDYVHCPAIADDYDDYFSYNALFQFDEQIVSRLLEEFSVEKSGWVVDLGCGTGRILVSLARRGYCGLAIDLSAHMLSIVRAKADREGLSLKCLHANLVELDCLTDRCCSLALCLFSTLGMICERSNRQRCLFHIRRITRPGGLFVLHVHNYWYNLYDRGGPWWLLRNALRALVIRDVEWGDKFFAYRGVPTMFLHVFRQRELHSVLEQAGFRVQEWIPLSSRRNCRLRWPWFFGSLRANGWIVVCQ